MSALQDLATMVGQALGATPSTAHMMGGLVLSVAVLSSVALALAAWGGRGKNNMMLTVVVLFVTMSLLYVMTWLDLSILIIACVIVAVMFAREVKEAVS